MRAPRDDAARWDGGAVIPSPALLLLLQTRKTLHHKGVWLLPQAPFLAAALRGASERARRLFLPLTLEQPIGCAQEFLGPDSRFTGNNSLPLR